jgi:FkbM family methyltransferase
MTGIFDKLSDVLKIIKHDKSFLKNIFKPGASLASEKILLSVKNYIPSLNTIIDVGANSGQFAIASSKIFNNVQIYSFEALPSLYPVLKKNTNEIKNLEIFNFALGSEKGDIEFFQNDYSLASSALEIHKNQTELFPSTSGVTKIKIKCDTLDNVSPSMKLTSPVLLKLDVQGFEKKVLEGAVETLKKVDYLLFETSFMPMYNNEPLFNEMNSYVNGLGFELIAPVGIFQASDMKIMQMDVLYKKIK